MAKLIAVAHRGYSERYPENTPLAYEAAIAAGAQVIESDARLTLDNRIMAVHDSDLRRLGDLDQQVSLAHSDVIRSLDLGRGEPPAFLEEVLEIAKGRAQVLLDMKTPDLNLASEVLRVVGRAGSGLEVLAGTRAVGQMSFMQEGNPAIRHVGLVPNCADIPLWRGRGVFAVRAWEDEMDRPEVAEYLTRGGTLWVTAGCRSLGEKPGFITKPRLLALEKAGAAAVLLNDPSLLSGLSVEF